MNKICQIKNCNKTIECRGLCIMHYTRFKRHGDPHKILRRLKGTGCIVDRGYKRIFVNNKPIKEHRHIMQQFLDRSLKQDEHVHHIDGNKLNNDINNLKIVTPSQHAKIHYSLPHNKMQKLYSKDTQEITSLLKQGFQKQIIARRFNVSPSTISYFLKRHNIHRESKLAKTDFKTIKELVNKGYTQQVIAKQYKVSQSSIWRFIHHHLNERRLNEL